MAGYSPTTQPCRIPASARFRRPPLLLEFIESGIQSRGTHGGSRLYLPPKPQNYRPSTVKIPKLIYGSPRRHLTVFCESPGSLAALLLAFNRVHVVGFPPRPGANVALTTSSPPCFDAPFGFWKLGASIAHVEPPVCTAPGHHYSKQSESGSRGLVRFHRTKLIVKSHCFLNRKFLGNQLPTGDDTLECLLILNLSLTHALGSFRVSRPVGHSVRAAEV